MARIPTLFGVLPLPVALALAAALADPTPLAQVRVDPAPEPEADVATLNDPAGPPRAIPQPDFSKLPTGRVLRVVDVTSVIAAVAGRGQELRLVGVEPPQAPVHVRAAKDFLENLLKGEQVYVRYAADPPRQDEFGRILAYVYRVPDGLFVNLELVRQGYAGLAADLPAEHRQTFEYYFRQARQAGRGQWAQQEKVGSASQGAIGGKTTQPTAPGDESADDPVVYVTRTGRKYHRADCPHLRKGGTPIKRSEARKRGLEPCSRCDPP